MDAIIANLKSQLGEIIKEEVKNTMTRLRGKICKALGQEVDVDMEKFAENTLTKIMDESVDLFSKTEEELKKTCVKVPKLKRDPDAPKPAVNAYIMYSRDNRSDVKEEHPDMKATDITKKLAEMWKSADDEMKQEYKEKAEKDKERYEKELEDYVPKEGYQNPKEKKSKSSKKKKSGPTKPLNAYMWFCKDKRESLKGKFNNTEILSELGKMWKGLSDKKKKPYVEKAEQDKERYAQEMKDYVPEDGEDVPKKGKGKKVKSEASKRPPTAFILFSKDKRAILKEEEPELKQPEIMKRLGEMWSSASKTEKKKYTDQSAKLLAEFKDSKDNKDGKKDEEVNEEEVNDEDVKEEEEIVEDEEEIVISLTGTPVKCMPNIVSDAKFAELKAAQEQKEKEEKKAAKKASKKKSDSDDEDNKKSSKKVKSTKKTGKNVKNDSDDEDDKKSSKKAKSTKKADKKSVVDMDTQLYDDEPILSDDE